MRHAPRNRTVATALVVLGAASGLARPTAAEPRLGADRSELRRELVDLQRRARELDEKIRHVEAELAREARARAVAPRTNGAKPAAAADCTLPYYLDGAGIRHLRAECLAPAGESSCDPPYSLDEQGLRRFRPLCAMSSDE